MKTLIVTPFFSKNDEKSNLNDVTSDDTEADPNFVDFSSELPESPTSDLVSAKTTTNSTEVKKGTSEAKVQFPCK